VGARLRLPVFRFHRYICFLVKNPFVSLIVLLVISDSIFLHSLNWGLLLPTSCHPSSPSSEDEDSCFSQTSEKHDNDSLSVSHPLFFTLTVGSGSSGANTTVSSMSGSDWKHSLQLELLLIRRLIRQVQSHARMRR
jgi:hypothetical protein